jgi:hypothetical protein
MASALSLLRLKQHGSCIHHQPAEQYSIFQLTCNAVKVLDASWKHIMLQGLCHILFNNLIRCVNISRFKLSTLGFVLDKMHAS